MENKTLEELAIELHDAKQIEKKAKNTRIVCEEEIAKLVLTGDNASKTVPAGDELKVTVKRATSYKPDVDAIRALDIPPDLMPIQIFPETTTPISYGFDAKAYEALKEQNGMIFAKVAANVEVVPRKVSVTVKLA